MYITIYTKLIKNKEKITKKIFKLHVGKIFSILIILKIENILLPITDVKLNDFKRSTKKVYAILVLVGNFLK